MAWFKDFCIDANNPLLVGAFWGRALSLTYGEQSNGDTFLTGPTPQHTIWINGVHEAKNEKLRIHIDVNGPSIEHFVALGASPIDLTTHEWAVLADPEGAEFCVFVNEEIGPVTGRENGTAPTSTEFPNGTSQRAVSEIRCLVFDSHDRASQAVWWANLLDANVVHFPDYSSVVGIHNAPFRSIDFVEVPEAKTVKNRIHIDVQTTALQKIIDSGATMLRPNDNDQIRWNVLADPEGNEFCAFEINSNTLP
jgi:hypothetical protein